jgi:hypothetical protein
MPGLSVLFPSTIEQPDIDHWPLNLPFLWPLDFNVGYCIDMPRGIAMYFL